MRTILTLVFVTATALMAPSQTIGVCAGDTIVLRLPVYRGDIQWQKSSDGVNWANIAGATYQPYYTTMGYTEKYYRAEITENTCNPVYSDVIHAVISGTCPFVCGTSTVTDVDGNVYNTVSIAGQCWLKENLKTSHYSNGSIIQNITDGTAWSSLTTGAFCWYNNDSTSYNNVYGKLYNWHAVNDSCGLCPEGFHVPNESEWNIMGILLDNTIDTNAMGLVGSDIGGKLKEAGTVHWTTPNAGATNISGFSALPGGFRLYNGSYIGILENSVFWSSTEFNMSNAWRRTLYYEYSNMNRYFIPKSCGSSVRCVMD